MRVVACLHALVVFVCALKIVPVGSGSHSVFGLAGSAVRLGLLSSFARIVGVGSVLLIPPVATLAVVCVLTHRSRRWVRLGSAFIGAMSLLVGAALFAADRFGLGSAGLAQVVAEVLLIAAGATLLAWAAAPPEPSQTRQVDSRSATLVVGGAVVMFMSLCALSVWASVRQPANSPSQSVQSFSNALAAGDLVTVAEQLDPRERNVLLRSGVSVVQQLRRLKMIDAGAATKPAKFRSNTSPVMVGRVHTLAADMAAVETTGAFAVPRGLVRSAGNRLAKSVSQPSQIVSVRIDGHWYVSLLHSAAEARRLQSNAGEIFPKVVQPVGSANPEGAVLDLFSGIAAVDLERTVAVLDPKEAAVAHRYARIFTQDADKAQRWSQSNAIGSFPNLGLSSQVNGDRAIVKVTRWSAELNLPSDIGYGTNVLLDGNCVTATVEKQISEHCGKDIPQVVADLFGVTAPNLGDLDWLENPRDQLEIVVVRRNGEWFVAPLSSALNSISLRMSKLGPKDVAGKTATDQWQRILLG